MNRGLSPDEQREFWAQLFAVVIRYENRARQRLHWNSWKTCDKLKPVKYEHTHQR
jgi:hypothetical protein